jgi:hypothetical protein
LYRVEVVLKYVDEVLDRQSFQYGFKNIRTKDKGLVLNGKPITSKSISVVWHRWVRSKEGRALAYDKTWFKRHLMQRSKSIGANTLRFHLGVPPERYLNWCDSMGFLVQYEWSFFHGMKANKESLIPQWQAWLDLANRHPSVSFIHPWNETEGPELETAWSAINTILPDYGPLIVAERDMLHVHKYWWGLFENLGLYYDYAGQFPLPVMADEFGGNYLDGYGNLGGYKTLVESYLRFLGRSHTAQERLYHHTIANARVAEYWRRIGVAGYSPFCALGSEEDGNHWFLGPLRDGKPKPVWEALKPAYQPIGVSLDLWDRHFSTNENFKVPVTLFNDTDKDATIKWSLTILDGAKHQYFHQEFTPKIGPFSHFNSWCTLTMPNLPNHYVIEAKTGSSVSKWDIKVFGPPVVRKNQVIYIHPSEVELRLWAKDLEITSIPSKADVALAGHLTWERAKNKSFADTIKAVKKWVWLQVGPQGFGQGYPTGTANPLEMSPLQGVAVVAQPKDSTFNLLDGLGLNFKEAAEPESHIHSEDPKQMMGLERKDLWLFNGLRGGLAIPAWEMKIQGLSAKAQVNQWLAKGADTTKLTQPYFAYELGG